MASLNFSFVSDIHDPGKCNLPSNCFDRCSVFPLSGSAQITGTCILINPFPSRFKRIVRASSSRFSTDFIDLSESKLELRDRYVRKRARSLWNRFRSVKKEIEEKVAANLSSAKKEDEKEQEQQDKRQQEHERVFVRDKIVGEKLEEDVTNFGSDSSLELCNGLLSNLEKISDDKALSFFGWMRNNGKLEGNVTAYNLALRVLSRKEDWEAAEMLLQEVISDSAPQKINFQVFNTLIYACHKKGLGGLGSKWFRLMLEYSVQPNIATFGMLMSLHQKSGNLADAEFTFHQMRSLKVKCPSAYSSMITIYTRLGMFDKSEEIIGYMKEDKVLQNLENWLVQVNAYSQQGKLKEAEMILKSMKEAGFSSNIVAYNMMITGYGKIFCMDDAECLFWEIQNVGLEPDETTYRSMVEGWGRANNYSKAKWYYKKLKQSGFVPNSSNLYTMLNLQARHGDEEGAMETVEDMRFLGCQYSSILSTLIQAYERAEMFHKVPLVVKGSFYEHVLVDQTSCSVLVMAYLKHSLVDHALQVLQEKQWKDSMFEDNLYHLLVCSCKEWGHHQEAIKVFAHMPKSDSNPNLHITSTMIDIYSTIGDFDRAKELYMKLKSSECALDMIAYSVIVRMYVKSGYLKDASLVLDTMEKEKIIPDVFLLRDMLRIYQRCGLHEKLAGLYYRCRKNEAIWDQEMYNCVINCCAHALPVDELSRIFDEMLRRGFTPNTITFNVILDIYGKARLFKKARKVFWMARKRGLADRITYNTIIAAYGRGKDLRNMRAIVKKMQFNGFSVSLEAYNCMLDAYGKSRQMEKLKSVLERMKESNCASDHYTYCILINIYGEQGWIEEVAGVLAELKECGIGGNLCSYNTLIKAYGIAGMVEEAVGVVKEMRGHGIEPDRVTYINLIRALQRNDNFLEAVKWSLWMKQIGMTGSKC